jgi:hypothetical protein
MNFRLLKNEELDPLKKEFVVYLSAHGIDAQLWEKLKVENVSVANDHLKQFSDSVWYKIFSNKKYMELSDKEATYHFDFQTDKVIILRVGKSITNVGKKEQNYVRTREEDMYQWAQQGAHFSDGSAYKEALMIWYDNRSN